MGATRGEGEHNSRAPNHCVATEKSQPCHQHFFQYRTFASERPQVRTRGRQTCFLPRAPSSLVTPLGVVGLTTTHKLTLPSRKSL